MGTLLLYLLVLLGVSSTLALAGDDPVATDAPRQATPGDDSALVVSISPIAKSSTKSPAAPASTSPSPTLATAVVTAAPPGTSTLPNHSPAQAAKASHKPTPVVSEQVFVPLHEWKEKKLQEIESVVKKSKPRRRSRSRPRRSPVVKRREGLQANDSTCMCSSTLAPFLLSRSPVCPNVVLAYPRAAQVVQEQDIAHHVTTNLESAPESEAESAGKSGSPNTEDIEIQHMPSMRHPADVSRVPAAREEAEALDLVTKPTPMSGMEHVDMAGQNEIHELERVKPSVTDEAPDVQASLGSRIGIASVGDIMKTLRMASASFSSSPEAVPVDVLHSRIPNGIQNASQNASHWLHNQPTPPARQPEILKNDPAVGSTTNPTSTTSTTPTNADDGGHVGRQPPLAGVNSKPFNYASADAGARVLATSSGAVGAKNVIAGNMDKYMLMPCAGEGIGGSRWIDVELSEEVILKSFETGNFEHYSSSARRVAVLGASTYPPAKWNVVAVFDFADVRSLQQFRIEKRFVARFLRVIYAGRQGGEYYCPVSTIRVFAKSLISDWKDVFERPKPQTIPSPMDDASIASQPRTLTISQTPKVSTPASAATLAKGHGQGAGDMWPAASDDIDAMASHTTSSQDLSSDYRTKESNSAGAAYGNDGNEVNEYNKETIGHGRQLGGQQSVTGTMAPGKPDADADRASQSREGSEGDANGADGEPTVDRNADGLSVDDQIVLQAVREEALSPASGDDNIFRKVTRMIRVLELNQSLTNQYIDTHLARYAEALAIARQNAARAKESAALGQAQLANFAIATQTSIDMLTAAAFKRDILICVLLVLVAFLLGTHWVMWSAVSGARLFSPRHDTEDVEFFLRHDDEASAISPSSDSLHQFVGQATPDTSRTADTDQKKKRQRHRDRRASIGADPLIRAINPHSDRQRAEVPSKTNGYTHIKTRNRAVYAMSTPSPSSNSSAAVLAGNSFGVLGSPDAANVEESQPSTNGSETGSGRTLPGPRRSASSSRCISRSRSDSVNLAQQYH